MALVVKNLPANAGGSILRDVDWKDLLEEGVTTHSSVLACRIPWTEEPGGLQSMGLQRVGHNWALSLSLFSLTWGLFSPASSPETLPSPVSSSFYSRLPITPQTIRKPPMFMAGPEQASASLLAALGRISLSTSISVSAYSLSSSKSHRHRCAMENIW